VNRQTALVTGASGFVGRWAVRALRNRGIKVRAGVHRSQDKSLFSGDDQVTALRLDILDTRSLSRAMEGVDLVFHFAALLDPMAESSELFRVNAEGTRTLWECAAGSAKAALYCSSTAVYGLLAGSEQQISESVAPRAVQPYGRSKLSGESAALDVSKRTGLPTVIIRPTAIFGPGQNTAFARALRKAAVSRILLADEFLGRRFSFVHVEDVVEAAIHLLGSVDHGTRIYNVAGRDPISFADAFRAYRNALKRSGQRLLRARFLALVSLALQKAPSLSSILSRRGGSRLGFRIWHPGFDITYSSKALIDTGFRFKWVDFEEVMLSCMVSGGSGRR
jgi:nucleoside-diphosphate-sugar epimerase